MIKISTLLIGVVVLQADIKAKVSGNIRGGAIQIEDNRGKKNSTLALGGNLGIKTAPIAGVSLATRFFTTNPIFGKDKEESFLGSTNNDYSIVGEAYIEANLGKTTIKAGRQLVDTPYAQIDDIGMVPDTFKGYTVTNTDLEDTRVVLAWLDKWAGFDAPIRDKFTDMQESKDAVVVGGVVYEGIENTNLQAWYYKLDNANFTYLEAGYEKDSFSIGGQYTDQDNGNSAYGLSLSASLDGLTLNSAYNKVDGVVSNGFGGGPFFTSSEDHTIAETEDQEALLLGAEYAYDKFTMGVTNVDFDKGENQTDYILSYAFNDKMSFDLIYSDMYDDGKMTRVFANYNF
ncbi:MAG TPA: outer membrane porin, OprD family [Campylobacterales bacterium]|nr:outer membrane porin, OprD family [Campylobacterales bacterium]